ncbi:MAG: DUF4390 domain-containing protein, partial [Acidobacteriota bacterium]
MRWQGFRPAALALLGMAAWLASGSPAAASGTDSAAAAGQPRVEILHLGRDATGIEVTFQIRDAFDERIRAKLASGLSISFVHQVEVRRRRVFWFSRTLAAKKIVTTAVLDTLTGQYTLTRKADGAMVETVTTSDVDEMKGFMTRIEACKVALPQVRLLPPHVEVRIRSRLDTRFFVLFPY